MNKNEVKSTSSHEMLNANSSRRGRIDGCPSSNRSLWIITTLSSCSSIGTISIDVVLPSLPTGSFQAMSLCYFTSLLFSYLHFIIDDTLTDRWKGCQHDSLWMQKNIDTTEWNIFKHYSIQEYLQILSR